MKSPLTIILIALSINVFSQTIVNEKYFEWQGYIFLKDFIQTQDSGFIIIGGSPDGNFIMKLNQDGDSLWHRKMPVSPYQVIQANNSDLIVVGSQNQNGFLYRMSNQGDSLTSFKYYFNYSDAFFSNVIELESGDLVLALNYQWPPSPWLTTLFCYDSYFEFKWAADLSDATPCDMVLSSGNIYLGGGAWGDRTWLAKLDTTGDIIYSGTYSGEGKTGKNLIISMSENPFLVTGYLETTNLTKFTPEGDEIWELYSTSSDEMYPRSICELDSNIFAFVGGKEQYLDFKIINGDADSISSFVLDDYNMAHNAPPHLISDHDCLTVAINIVLNSKRALLFLKLLKNDLLTITEENYIETNKRGSFVFPNPANKKIEIKHPLKSGKKLSVNIFDLEGNLRLSKDFISTKSLSVNIDNLETGTYLIQLLSENISQCTKLVVVN